MRGLIIKPYWLKKILSGEKTIEVRGFKHRFMGERVWLLASGGWCLGSAILGEPFAFDCISWQSLRLEHCVDMPFYNLTTIYSRPYGWRLLDVKPCAPFRYRHPMGAVIWVRDVVPL